MHYEAGNVRVPCTARCPHTAAGMDRGDAECGNGHLGPLEQKQKWESKVAISSRSPLYHLSEPNQRGSSFGWSHTLISYALIGWVMRAPTGTPPREEQWVTDASSRRTGQGKEPERRKGSLREHSPLTTSSLRLRHI